MDLTPTIIQDAVTGDVLTLAYSNEESLAKMRETGETWLWSRKRGLWHKGGTSGNIQQVVRIGWDCDQDALLVQVLPHGPACHQGTRSCWQETALVTELDDAIHRRKEDPEGPGYTRFLLQDRNHIVKKLGEEGAEVLQALLAESDERLVSEVADLLYLLVVALRSRDISFRAVLRTLFNRRRNIDP